MVGGSTSLSSREPVLLLINHPVLLRDTAQHSLRDILLRVRVLYIRQHAFFSGRGRQSIHGFRDQLMRPRRLIQRNPPHPLPRSSVSVSFLFLTCVLG